MSCSELNVPYVQTSVDADCSPGPALSVSCSERNVPYVQTSVDADWSSGPAMSQRRAVS